MGFRCPNPKIIYLSDEIPGSGGLKNPIEIDDEVEVIGVKEMRRGSSPINPIVVERERFHQSGVYTFISLNSKRCRSSKKPLMKADWVGKTIIEVGESSGITFKEKLKIAIGGSSFVSSQPDCYCEICTESKYAYELFAIEGCCHSYCKNCLSQYVASKVENNVVLIKCPSPDCKKGILEPAKYSRIIENGVFNRWCTALCESMVDDKFYCPFSDCSALMIKDNDSEIEEAECPHCSRLFCAQCRVPWHAGFSCTEFQKIDKNERKAEDLKLMNLAKNSQWQRCPKCKFFVEKVDGCMFIRCRCGFSFCYGCATEMGPSHYCAKCKR